MLIHTFTLVHANNGQQHTSVKWLQPFGLAKWRDVPKRSSGTELRKPVTEEEKWSQWLSYTLPTQTWMREGPLKCVFLLTLDLFLCPSLLIIAAFFFSLYVAGLLLDHALALKSRKSQSKMIVSPNMAHKGTIRSKTKGGLKEPGWTGTAWMSFYACVHEITSFPHSFWALWSPPASSAQSSGTPCSAAACLTRDGCSPAHRGGFQVCTCSHALRHTYIYTARGFLWVGLMRYHHRLGHAWKLPLKAGFEARCLRFAKHGCILVWQTPSRFNGCK